jgi:hypothetical protein
MEIIRWWSPTVTKTHLLDLWGSQWLTPPNCTALTNSPQPLTKPRFDSIVLVVFIHID